ASRAPRPKDVSLALSRRAGGLFGVGGTGLVEKWFHPGLTQRETEKVHADLKRACGNPLRLLEVQVARCLEEFTGGEFARAEFFESFAVTAISSPLMTRQFAKNLAAPSERRPCFLRHRGFLHSVQAT